MLPERFPWKQVAALFQSDHYSDFCDARKQMEKKPLFEDTNNFTSCIVYGLTKPSILRMARKWNTCWLYISGRFSDFFLFFSLFFPARKRSSVVCIFCAGVCRPRCFNLIGSPKQHFSKMLRFNRNVSCANRSKRMHESQKKLHV